MNNERIEEVVIIEEANNTSEKVGESKDKAGVFGQAVAVGVNILFVAEQCVSVISEFGEERQYNLYQTRQGHGRVAEDIAKEKHSDWDYAPQEYKKNEPDLITSNGNPIQVKACKTAAKTVENLYERGEFKYKNNIIAVPNNQVKEVTERLRSKGRNEDVEGIGATYEDIQKCKKRGLESFKYDAIHAAKQPSIELCAVGAGVAAGVFFYQQERRAAASDGRGIKWTKVVLKSMGCAAATFGLMIMGCTYKGYKNRPA